MIMFKISKKIIICFFILLFIGCEEKLTESDINQYKQIMDIRLGHLGNAIIMQGRLLDSYNLNNFRADEDHFKEAEELIKGHLSKLGRPDELKSLRIPNSKTMRNLHENVVDASELMITAISTLEDQAWLGGSVSFAEASLEDARYKFQVVVKEIYELDEDVKPVYEHKEYEVGEKPEVIELK